MSWKEQPTEPLFENSTPPTALLTKTASGWTAAYPGEAPTGFGETKSDAFCDLLEKEKTVHAVDKYSKK